MVAAALIDSAPLLMVLLLASGMGWMVMLSTFNTTLQLTLATWVRARGLSAYLIVFLGGQGLGALIWGAVGQWIGVPLALLVATGLLIVGTATLLRWRLSTETLDRTVTSPWPDPEIDVEPESQAGPVVVEVTYVVEEQVEEFLAAVRALGLSRRRTGATSWALYSDVSDHSVFVEVFSVPTWNEHLRQHYERLTGYDQELELRVEAFDARGADGGSTTRHLVAVRGS